MRTFIVFCIPPIVGAFIGFITNVIAIKMLFRPLNEIRIFGIRLPFTPGILPRQRHKLADSIGAMVERELLTPDLLRQRFSLEDVQKKLKDSISRFTEHIIERPLNEFFGDKVDADITGLLSSFGSSVTESPAFLSVTDLLKKRICTMAEEQYQAVAGTIIGTLHQNNIHRELEIHGRYFLSGVILQLNVFQRFFISAAQYDRTLSEQMPEIIDSLIDHIWEILREENTKKRVLEYFEIILNRYLKLEKAADGFLSSLKDEFIKCNGEEPLKNLLSISYMQKEKIDGMLCSRLLRLADEEIENLLKTINVRTMVSQRIDELDMIRVEKIILDVMANQLKWIDVFGAILGFFIGVIQVLINLIMR